PQICPLSLHDALPISEVVIRYSRNNASLLLRQGVQMLVVACNTASAHALEVLRAELPVPVFGVVEPGVEAAVRARPGGRIGVIRSEEHTSELQSRENL